MNKEEILNYLSQHDMIDMDVIQEQIAMNEKQRYLKMHEFTIWQGKDGAWFTYLQDSGKRKLIRRVQKKDLEDIIIDFYKKNEEIVYIAQIFKEWIEQKLEFKEISKQTYDRYYIDYNNYLEKSTLASIPFQNITETILEDFIKKAISDKQMTIRQWNNIKILLIGMFKYGKKYGYTTLSASNFFADLLISSKSFKQNYKADEEQVFTNEEVAKIIEYINSKPESMMNLGIKLVFQTGLRAGELASLSYSDMKNGILYITKTEIKYKNINGNTIRDVRNRTKGRDGQRKIILTQEAISIINRAHELNPNGKYLFENNNIRIWGNSFSKKLMNICRYVKIPVRSLHKIRKTYATNLLNARLDDKIIEKQMGHTTIDMTRNFYYFDNHNKDVVKDQIENALKYFD